VLDDKEEDSFLWKSNVSTTPLCVPIDQENDRRREPPGSGEVVRFFRGLLVIIVEGCPCVGIKAALAMTKSRALWLLCVVW